MLLLISSALGRFVSPITGSNTRNTVQPNKERHPVQEEFQQKKHPKLKVIRGGIQEEPQNSEAHSPPPEESAPATTQPMVRQPSVTQSFLQLLNIFQEQKNIFVGWLGKQAYLLSSQRQKKQKRIKKGAMLDERIE